MKPIRWFTLVVVGLSLSIGSTGCLKSKQVWSSSVVPDFPVSPSVQDTPVSTNPAHDPAPKARLKFLFPTF